MYVLSLTPAGVDGPTVVAHIEIDGGQPRVVELTVRPGSDGLPLPPEVADLDFRLLAEQAAALSTGHLPFAHDSPAPVHGPPTGNGRDDAAEPSPTRLVGKRRTSPPESPGPVTKGVPSDLGKIYWKLGSVAKVADYYDVPRQIARGWVKALRNGGALPDPWFGSAGRRK
jgi:hypothetical protein